MYAIYQRQIFYDTMMMMNKSKKKKKENNGTLKTGETKREGSEMQKKGNEEISTNKETYRLTTLKTIAWRTRSLIKTNMFYDVTEHLSIDPEIQSSDILHSY